VSQAWPENFQVPWDKMPLDIQTAISEGKRPPPDKRWQMIRILADEVQKYEANPTRSQCLKIGQKINYQYPDSFADMTRSEKLIAGGYSSLLSQLKTRIENINRSGGFRRYRSSGPYGIAGVKRGPTGVLDSIQNSLQGKLMTQWRRKIRDYRALSASMALMEMIGQKSQI
ncbi:hypothetical protein GOODEAATRI_031165, partial [Goodea atripinnis]